MKLAYLLSAFVLLMSAASRPASAVVLDFESLAFTGSSSESPQSISATPTTYSEDGYTLQGLRTFF